MSFTVLTVDVCYCH